MVSGMWMFDGCLNVLKLFFRKYNLCECKHGCMHGAIVPMVLSRLDGNFLAGWPIWGNSHSFTYSELDSPEY